LRPED